MSVPKSSRVIKRLLNPKVIAAALVLLLVTIWLINYWVSMATRKQLYTPVQSIPHRKVGLLLGTTRILPDGHKNLYYFHRIRAAVLLFQAGKIDYILVSGDNGTNYYNETGAMQADLIVAGIPAGRIVCDYAGFRTLDSILRCKKVFGETAITIISQRFHNERALFIANHKGMDAIAFNATDVAKRSGIRVQLREKLARVKMLLDLAFNVGPKFYGPPVRIG